MSGNVFIVCLTVVVVSIIFAFCHWVEHQSDITDDRYQYLCGQIADLKKDLGFNQDNCQTAIDSSLEIFNEFKKLKDDLILMLSDIVSAVHPEKTVSCMEETFTCAGFSPQLSESTPLQQGEQ